MKHLLILVALCALAKSAGAQTFEVSGGSSSLFNAQGATVTMFTPKSTTTASVGLANGHLVAGLNRTFEWKGWEVNAGDKQLSLTTGSAALSVATRGFALQRKGKKDSLAVFVGAVGRAYSSSFFGGTEAKDFGTGIEYRRRLAQALTFGTVQSITGRRQTSLEEMRWTWRALDLAEAGGKLPDSVFDTATATFHPSQAFMLTGGHYDLFLPQRASYDSAQVGSRVGPVDGFASVFDSRFGLAEAIGSGVHLGALSTRVGWYRSPQQRPLSTASTSLSTARFTSTLTLTRTGNQSTYALGGAYHGNRFGLSLDHAVLYNVLTGRFQQTTMVTLSLRSPLVSVNLAGLIANRRVKYTAYGTGYAYGNFVSAEMPAQQSLGGKFVLSGTVKDEQGTPVEGAAVTVSGQTVYSNTCGDFFVRLRSAKAVVVRVEPQSFTAPGRWDVVDAPSSAAPGQAVQITVRRQR